MAKILGQSGQTKREYLRDKKAIKKSGEYNYDGKPVQISDVLVIMAKWLIFSFFLLFQKLLLPFLILI